MNSFVQEVFNKISLERDPELWRSEDDLRTKTRLTFLSGFEETLFSQQLLNDKDASRGLCKNARMCNTVKRKLEDVSFSSNVEEEQEKKLALLNLALCFADIPEKGSSVDFDYCDNTFIHLLHERIAILSTLKYTEEALEDVKVLEEYICDLEENASAPKLAEYYTEFFKLKFSLVLDCLGLDDHKKEGYRRKFKSLEDSKDYEGLKELISSLDQIYSTDKQHPLSSNGYEGINRDQGNLVLLIITFL